MAVQQTFAFFDADRAVSPQTAAAKTTARPKPAAPIPSVSRKFLSNKIRSTEIHPAEPEMADDVETHTQQAPSSDDRESVLQKLRAQVGCVSTALAKSQPKLSTGCQEIDQLLPCGGLKIDSLTEWVAGSNSSGAAAVSFIAAASYLKENPSRPLVIVDDSHQFYPPAASALGIPEDQMILVRPQRHADVVWAIDQSLRCTDVAAVWANVGAWLNDRDARRFQLAAEIGNTPAFLVRPASVRGRPTFADIRFHVGSQNRDCSGKEFPAFAVQITIDRCRGDGIGKQVWVHLDEQARLRPIADQTLHAQPEQDSHEHHANEQVDCKTAAMHLANQLAHPAVAPAVDRRHRA